ncbi:MAG: hypothetical protein K6U88_13915, partial [Dehalococcoidia bacterium]|nr:hypothetical protein [Dehalococcoidia bacterium]
VRRLRPGEVAFVDHPDLDRVAAKALVRCRARAVVNASPSLTGRYPAEGTDLLLEAGIPVVDRVGEAVFAELADGDPVALEWGEAERPGGPARVRVRNGARVVAEGRAVTREILEEEYPECTVSVSSQVLPEYREYERTIATLVDAYVKPHMSRYLRRVKDALGPDLREKPFLVMQSNGGVMSAEQVVNKPITTALSGPAAGVLGAAVVARLAGFDNVVTLDAGGTSTDLSLIEGGIAQVTNAGSVGPFPVRIPMIAIETIGTGGGSIAWISREGHLKVGPKSAGADPGPMCYPNGGTEPTITDANLVLGRLPAALIGGGITLDVARAREGMVELGRKLGSKMTAEEIAAGIIEIANWNQANRIRQMTIQRGIDPRDFALLSFGGAGPVQSGAVMELVGMKACIVPPSPGNLAAFGLLAVDWRNDRMITRVMPEEKIDLGVLAELYGALEADAVAQLERDGIPRGRIRLMREADIRYVGQSMEVRVGAPDGPIDAAFVTTLIDAFHAAHRRTFGYDYRSEQKTEIVNLRVSGFGLIDRPSLPKLARSMGKPQPKGLRPVYFGTAMRETEIYDRATLLSGACVEGPAVVEEFGSTTVVFPGQTLTVDDHGIMVIRRNSTHDGAER